MKTPEEPSASSRAAGAESADAASTAIGRNIVLVGMTSLFTDISTEMVYPLYQAFVSWILTAQKALVGPVLGVIEGIAESTAALTKVAAGYHSDRIRNRKRMAIGGYGLSALARLLLFLASLGWPILLLARFLDRVGKGIRTAPRDALIAESAATSARGRAYGLHRAMDFAGATLGALLAWAVCLRFLDPHTGNLSSLRAFYILFSLSFLPAIVGLLFLLPVREACASPPLADRPHPRPDLNLRHYDRRLRRFFLAQFIFTLGNSSNQFLLLRSRSLGMTLSTTILMYIVFNLTTTLLSAAFGSLSDRIGRRKLLTAGYGLYAVVYAAFGLLPANRALGLWLLWPLYGVYYAMTEGVEKALVAELAPAESRATALGMYQTIVGLGLLPASVIAGLLFRTHVGAPFVFGGVLALVAAALVARGVRN